MTMENEARGRSNRAAGARAMHRAVAWLRAHGAVNADRVTSPHLSDITGIGDMAVEVTVVDWQQIGKKADQAAADAARRGLDTWCVWKPRRGIGDMGRAWCVTEFAQWWRLHQELAELRVNVRVLADAIRPGATAAAGREAEIQEIAKRAGAL
jgi:hypothetical protein